MGLSAQTGHTIMIDSDVCDEEPDHVTLTKYTLDTMRAKFWHRSQSDQRALPAAASQGYTWGLDLSGSLQGAGGVGGLLAAVETQGTASTSDDTNYWFIYDANGNVVQILDPTSDIYWPDLAATYEYDPYGNTLAVNDVDQSGYANANPFRFSTKWLDTELAAANQTGAIGETGLSRGATPVAMEAARQPSPPARDSGGLNRQQRPFPRASGRPDRRASGQNNPNVK